MQNMNFTKRDLLIDEVNIDHDVLDSSVMNGVNSHVYNIDVVTEDNRGRE
jgi:hypothetical protein